MKDSSVDGDGAETVDIASRVTHFVTFLGTQAKLIVLCWRSREAYFSSVSVRSAKK